MTKPNTETVVETIRLKFKSGNEIPVESVRITTEEWQAVERENVELRAKLADRDSGWYAAERGEPRDGSKSVDWLNGWENWAALDERDTLRAQLAQAREHHTVPGYEDCRGSAIREIIDYLNEKIARAQDVALERAARLVIDHACDLNKSGRLFPEDRGELDVVRRSYAAGIRALKKSHNSAEGEPK